MVIANDLGELEAASLRGVFKDERQSKGDLIMAVTTQQDKSTSQRASSAVDTAKDVMGKVGDAAHGAMESASQMASDAASFIGKKAENAASAVGSGIKSVAGSIESGGKYIQNHSMSEIGNDVTSLVRNNPIPAVLIALGVGFLFARAIRG
jgi:ElaB/YqjD/DUF883 family membrane-anchored ribosome-binding protein